MRALPPSGRGLIWGRPASDESPRPVRSQRPFELRNTLSNRQWSNDSLLSQTHSHAHETRVCDTQHLISNFVVTVQCAARDHSTTTNNNNNNSNNKREETTQRWIDQTEIGIGSRPNKSIFTTLIVCVSSETCRTVRNCSTRWKFRGRWCSNRACFRPRCSYTRRRPPIWRPDRLGRRCCNSRGRPRSSGCRAPFRRSTGRDTRQVWGPEWGRRPDRRRKTAAAKRTEKVLTADLTVCRRQTVYFVISYLSTNLIQLITKNNHLAD